MSEYVHGLVISNSQGRCVTEKGLDAFWPTDDREVDMTSSTFKLFQSGKGAQTIPNCPDDVKYYDEEASDKGKSLLSFVFGGEPLPETPKVPTPEAFVLMLSALVIGLIFKGKRG